MTRWTPDELAAIGAAGELDIAALRPDDTLRPYTTIWVVRVGDGLYTAYRSKYGRYDRGYFDPMTTPGSGHHPAPHCRPNRHTTSHGRTPVTATTEHPEPSGAEMMFGDFAPGLVTFTDNVLFGDAWERPRLAPRDRSLITVAALTVGGNADQLTFHLQYAKDNGATEAELIEAITHLAFYAGWPKAFSAMAVAKQVFRNS